MRTAIITGASSGLGSEFVRQISQKEELDEIWIIARRRERLEALADTIGCQVRIFALDLTKKASLDAIRAALEQMRPDVRILVNAAGFGKMGTYKDISIEDCDGMIDLNCRAAMDVTLIVLPFMGKKSRVIEIASTAAFQPLAGIGVYAASKAFLMRFSRSLRWELLGSGIHVTCVCPYWVKDTEFIKVTRRNANAAAVKHFPLAGKAKGVVSLALLDSRLNLPISTPGIVSTIHRILAKFIPHFIMQAGWELIRRI